MSSKRIIWLCAAALSFLIGLIPGCAIGLDITYSPEFVDNDVGKEVACMLIGLQFIIIAYALQKYSKKFIEKYMRYHYRSIGGCINTGIFNSIVIIVLTLCVFRSRAEDNMYMTFVLQSNMAITTLTLLSVLCYFVYHHNLRSFFKCMSSFDEYMEEFENKKLFNNFNNNSQKYMSFKIVTDLSTRQRDTYCSICHEDYTHNDNIVILKDCSHYFHDVCINSYFKTKAHLLLNCPVCKTNVT
jgi:hypothetical protein